MGKYVKSSEILHYNDILKKNYSLSPSLYYSLSVKNSKLINLSEFLERPLSNLDLGSEVGSINYIDKSDYKFITTKALISDRYNINMTAESYKYILPNCFTDMQLKEGDIIISKDSNIGETVILDRDYQKATLCGAIYKLPLKDEWKYYILAILKNPFFKEQLDVLVPKGATIRHANTQFLNCKIPLPVSNIQNVVKFISTISKAIVQKEKEIDKRFSTIEQLIGKEIFDDDLVNKFEYSMPRYNEFLNEYRLDTGIYSYDYKLIDYLIKNYHNGYFLIPIDKIKSGNTPIDRCVGSNCDFKYKWITPTNCSDNGTLNYEYINMTQPNNLNSNCIVIVNRTSRGGKGEYVGISGYYDYDLLGKGHHNQGLYQINCYSKEILIQILCCLNSKYYRKLCACLSAGSKMKELKSLHIASIPFPNLKPDIVDKINELYHNNLEYNINGLSVENFIDYDEKFNKSAGMYQIDYSKKVLLEYINNVIDRLVNGFDINCKL